MSNHTIDTFFYNKLSDPDKEWLLKQNNTPMKRLEDIKKKIGSDDKEEAAGEKDNVSNCKL